MLGWNSTTIRLENNCPVDAIAKCGLWMFHHDKAFVEYLDLFCVLFLCERAEQNYSRRVPSGTDLVRDLKRDSTLTDVI